jgi:2-polyprenyl-3-methyl-5-hydroxy-6-metoxy-1,4-benzoquinol methylase
MPNDEALLLTDKDYLLGQQYRTTTHLATRQSIYQFEQPRVDLPAAVLRLARLTGAETVADIGCGNGVYLAELARRGHGGRILGVDLSAGMLQAARVSAEAAGLLAADAAALPLADHVADITLAPHMLYHVPDKPAAVRELRRITRPGGQVLVVLNAADHLAGLSELAVAAAVDFGLPRHSSQAEIRPDGGVDLDTGAALLAREFASVERHEFVSELALPDPQPVLDYIASMRLVQSVADSGALIAAAARLLPELLVPARGDGIIRIRTHTGCLVCR